MYNVRILYCTVHTPVSKLKDMGIRKFMELKRNVRPYGHNDAIHNVFTVCVLCMVYWQRIDSSNPKLTDCVDFGFDLVQHYGAEKSVYM